MDSPAMAAGLQSGDVLTKMDGDSIFTVDGYENRLLELAPGDTVKLHLNVREQTDTQRLTVKWK